MASPVSPWPGYPEIPIFLDTRTGYPSPCSKRSTTTTIDTTKSNSPVSPLQPPHSITVTPPRGPAAQSLQIPNVQSSHQPSQEQSTERSPVRHLSPVEYPNVNKVSESWSTRGPKSRSPKHTWRTPKGPSSISQFRFGDHPSSHKGGYTPLGSEAPHPSGLGIMGSTCPTAPPAYGSPQYSHTKAESTPNIAERIEDRLWQYSMHGNVFKRWLLEIISWSISLACMLGIIIPLWFLNKNPLRSWPAGNTFTLNAYVAVLSRIASAALLLPVSEALGQLKWTWFFQGTSKKMWDFEIFDNASRGPWGSFQLLLRTKGRKLAALGAAIVLLALALDPFFQQVVQTPISYTILQEKGTIPQSVKYAPRYEQIFRKGVLQASTDRILALVANNFFYNIAPPPVMNGKDPRPDISVQCPTGHCTWEPYDTLGVCNACADVSKQLTHKCMTSEIDWVSTLNGTFNPQVYPNASVCGWFLNATSRNPMMVSGYLLPNQSIPEEALLVRMIPLLSVPDRIPMYGGSINFKQYRNPIANVLIFGAMDGSDSVYRGIPPVATECVLTWCVKTLNSTYWDGHYREDTIRTFINTTAGPFPWRTNRTRTALGVTVLTEYTQDIILDNVQDGGNITGYGVSNETAIKVNFMFDELFPSFYTKSKNAEPALRHKLSFSSDPMTRSFPQGNNPWMSPNNVTLWMEKFAKAMTDQIRSDPNATKIPGKAFLKETYVQVRWEWLILPVGLLISTGIFLVATVIRTTRDNIGVWKTSAVATLLYGFPDDMQKKIASSATEGTPRSKAKEMKVKLEPGKGWRISGKVPGWI